MRTWSSQQLSFIVSYHMAYASTLSSSPSPYFTSSLFSNTTPAEMNLIRDCADDKHSDPSFVQYVGTPVTNLQAIVQTPLCSKNRLISRLVIRMDFGMLILGTKQVSLSEFVILLKQNILDYSVELNIIEMGFKSNSVKSKNFFRAIK